MLSKASRGPLISAKDFEKILDCSSEPYRSIFSFLRSTGLKIKELEYLTWQQVDFHRNVIFVKYREIPLNAPALSILKNAFEHVIDHKASVFLDLNGRSFESFQLEIYFAEAVAKAQLGPEVSIASLRDAFARDLLSKRLSFLMVGKILGIHDIAKLMYYSSSIPLTREDVFTGAHGA